MWRGTSDTTRKSRLSILAFCKFRRRGRISLMPTEWMACGFFLSQSFSRERGTPTDANKGQSLWHIKAVATVFRLMGDLRIIYLYASGHGHYVVFFFGHPTRDTRRDDNPQEPLLGRSRGVTPDSHGCRKLIHKLWVRVRAPQEGFDSIRLWLTVICFVNLGALLRILRLVVRTCICHYETTWADEWSGTGWRHPRTFSHNKSVTVVRASESQLLRCSPHNSARSAAVCIHSIPWCHQAKRGGMGWGANPH